MEPEQQWRKQILTNCSSLFLFPTVMWIAYPWGCVTSELSTQFKWNYLTWESNRLSSAFSHFLQIRAAGLVNKTAYRDPSNQSTNTVTQMTLQAACCSVNRRKSEHVEQLLKRYISVRKFSLWNWFGTWLASRLWFVFPCFSTRYNL